MATNQTKPNQTLFKLLIYLQWQQTKPNQTKLFIGFDSMVKNYPTWNVDNVSKKLKKPAHHAGLSKVPNFLKKIHFSG